MMKKSLLTVSVLGVVCATTGVAFAADNTSSTYCKPGFYAGLQGGRGDTFYHGDDVFKQVETNGSGPSSINTGDGTISMVNSNILTAQKVDDVGLAGRLFAGYQFNPYAAAEVGYTQWNKTDFSANVDSRGYIYENNQPVAGSQSDSYSSVSGEITEHAIDLVAKATMPLEAGFGVYAKAGMAYITATRDINETSNNVSTTTSASGVVTPVSSGPQTLGTLYTKTYQAFRPTYGAGIDYTIPNTQADVEVFYSEVAGSGAIPTASLWGMGVSYKFA